MRWAGHVVLMGKPKGKRPPGRPRRRWEDGIRIDLREISWGSVDWIQMAQDRDLWRALVNTVMNIRVLAPPEFLMQYIYISFESRKSSIYGNQDFVQNK
jgi:hypothetical protein